MNHSNEDAAEFSAAAADPRLKIQPISSLSTSLSESLSRRLSRRLLNMLIWVASQGARKRHSMNISQRHFAVVQLCNWRARRDESEYYPYSLYVTPLSASSISNKPIPLRLTISSIRSFSIGLSARIVSMLHCPLIFFPTNWAVAPMSIKLSSSFLLSSLASECP